MEKNLDLNIKILKDIQENGSPLRGYHSQNIKIDSFSGEEISYNLELLHDAGYVLFWDEDTHMSSEYKTFLIRRLTNSGEDFVKLSSNKGAMEWVKKQILPLGGGVTLEIA